MSKKADSHHVALSCKMSELPLVSGDRLLNSVERFEDHSLNHS
jgi:hypothetical protein